MTERVPEARVPRIEAKLHAPRPTRRLVHRSRLASRPLRGQEPLLTLVSAPAGFGKTTLVAEWFANTERPTAWLSLDASDSDAGVFWSYLIASIQAVVPQAGSEASSLLDAAASTLRAVTASLLNDLEAFATDLVVILDDFHVIESPDVQESLAFFLDHLPPQIHFVITSRVDPALPLARMRARGDLLELRAADLRFTPDEAATYFRDAMGLDLDEDEVGALEARTEGWIAALQLAALSMQGRDDVDAFIAGFTGNDRFVVDYLVDEVLERQSEEVREFLVTTSILTRLEGSLCDAVTGGSGGRSTLERLERANLFVVPLDDRRSWYRYHHLFADVVRARLADERPDRVPELHRRASDWYDAHDERMEAISHALAGEHFERAAELIELATPMLRRTRQEVMLRRWLEALPDDVARARPVLSVSIAGARLVLGDTAGVEQLLDAAESRLDRPAGTIVFDEDAFAKLPTQIAAFRAGFALLAGDITATMAHARRGLAVARYDDHLGRGSVTTLLGLAYWTSGDLEAARPLYIEAVPQLEAAGHFADVLGVCLGLADIQVAQGRLGDAAETFALGLERAERHGGLRGTADMHVGMSEVLIERNELVAAADHLQQSADLGEHAGLPQHAYRWRVVTARLRHAHGDIEGALELLDEAERLYNTDFSPAVRPVSAMKARMHLSRGDVDAARRWMTDRGLTADDAATYVREFEHVTVARTLLASSRIDDALTLLGRLLAAAELGGRGGTVIEVLILQALAEHSRGNAGAATDAIDGALLGAEREGYVRVFLDAGPTLAPLLRAASASEAGRYARRILAAENAPVPAPTPRRGLVEELSPRELDVLRLLRSDLSGPDIARELLVSLNTLRTHTKNIYAKLGVNNRREAVSRAAQLGL